MLCDVKECGQATILCLAAAHALVRLDDGTIVGDPMEKITLEALDWKLAQGGSFITSHLAFEPQFWSSGDVVSPASSTAPHRSHLLIRRRFQFSSALKRMSTVSSLPGKTLIAVKGAPEAIKHMLVHVPDGYDDAYKYFMRRGSRVLALGSKEMQSMSIDKVKIFCLVPLSACNSRQVQIHKLARGQVESQLFFAGFLVFHCPLKADAVESLKMLADSSHRVGYSYFYELHH